MKALSILVALAVAGCASLPAPRPTAANGAWTLQASATAGSALVWTDSRGEGLRIACRRNPADLWLATPRLKGTPGAVWLATGGDTFQLTAEGVAPVLSAVGPVPETLPSAITAGGGLGVRQGPRALAFPSPDPKTATAFAIACRGPLR
ncbi:hypothetical protein [Phenylobacterium sp.]|jgi:hypothetical protein|uniref:hypothetical protein n=1 Tax=Phenylobacterium sp. TaxID=1871053 RepID=UPI002F953010